LVLIIKARMENVEAGAIIERQLRSDFPFVLQIRARKQPMQPIVVFERIARAA